MINVREQKKQVKAFIKRWENRGNERQPVNVYIGNKKVYSGYGQYVSSENNMYGTNIIKV